MHGSSRSRGSKLCFRPKTMNIDKTNHSEAKNQETVTKRYTLRRGIRLVQVKKVPESAWPLHLMGDLVRGSADRHYAKRNVSILDNNHLTAKYTVECFIHNASWRSQKATRYLNNANGLTTSFNLFKTFGFQKLSKCFQRLHQRFTN